MDNQNQMIVLNKGLNLYHSGYINSPKTMKELKKYGIWTEKQIKVFKEKVPEGEVDESIPDHAKFFTLSAEKAYSYDVDDIVKGATKYKLKKPVILLDLKDKENFELQTELQKVWTAPGVKAKVTELTKCFDGWIGYDDIIEPWREIFLFRPWEVISKGKRYYMDKSKIQKSERVEGKRYYHYPYQQKELDNLNKHLIGCYNVSVTGKKIKILSEMKQCDTLSLKYLGD